MTNLKIMIEDMAIDRVDDVLNDDFFRHCVEAVFDEIDLEERVAYALHNELRDAVADAVDDAIDAAIRGVM